jgi:hypothetical protein
MRLYNSLLQNKTTFEICFVGPNLPDFDLPDNFLFTQSQVKPAQCYEAAFRMCSGELVGWIADDCDYNDPALNCPNALDIMWQAYQQSIDEHKDAKTILAQRTIEEGTDISDRHFFFHGMPDTPRMAPLGFINREFFTWLGGYDKNFICGQSENDVAMRAIANGGRVVFVPESKISIHHGECHGDYPFRDGYDEDRKYLETCWVREGYGTYENHRSFTISAQRLRPLERFLDTDLLVKNQGPAGRWA